MTSHTNAKLKRVFPVLFWAVLILLVSSIPKPLETAPSGLSNTIQGFRFLGMGGVTLVSFIIHFSLYAVLGFLVGRAFMLKRPKAEVPLG